MMVQGRVIGVISIQSLEQEHAFDEGHVDLLSAVANQAAVAIGECEYKRGSIKKHVGKSSRPSNWPHWELRWRLCDIASTTPSMS